MVGERYISIIIPNYNGAGTIGKCLESVLSSKYQNIEVIVVDDCSEDNSADIIKGFPFRLIQLERHSGASKARNMGAQNSLGESLFFIDADCLLREDTLALANKTIEKYNKENIPPPNPPLPSPLSEERGLQKEGVSGITVIGGTYTRDPCDDDFFSTFQSIFINYSETKHKDDPDYIATHAMIIDKRLFIDSGGFREDFPLPILEDVEFSHRLRRAGHRLVINPEILVQHIFNFSLYRSLKNAARKSMYWTIYSIGNRDILKDSGTASVELKINVLSYFFSLLVVFLYLLSGISVFLITIPFILGVNIYLNIGLIKAFYETKGLLFTLAAILYYTMLYPLGVGAGAFAGILRYFLLSRIRERI